MARRVGPSATADTCLFVSRLQNGSSNKQRAVTLTGGGVGEQVSKQLVLAGDLDRRHADGEARAGALFLRADQSEQPVDCARNDAE